MSWHNRKKSPFSLIGPDCCSGALRRIKLKYIRSFNMIGDVVNSHKLFPELPVERPRNLVATLQTIYSLCMLYLPHKLPPPPRVHYKCINACSQAHNIIHQRLACVRNALHKHAFIFPSQRNAAQSSRNKKKNAHKNTLKLNYIFTACTYIECLSMWGMRWWAWVGHGWTQHMYASSICIASSHAACVLFASRVTTNSCESSTVHTRVCLKRNESRAVMKVLRRPKYIYTPSYIVYSSNESLFLGPYCWRYRKRTMNEQLPRNRTQNRHVFTFLCFI